MLLQWHSWSAFIALTPLLHLPEKKNDDEQEEDEEEEDAPAPTSPPPQQQPRKGGDVKFGSAAQVIHWV